MKKALSLVLAAALVGTLALPAAAAENADARLTAVTGQVKTTLGLDTEGYEQFYGELSENELAPTWSLEWSGENGNISVTAAEDGKILNFGLYAPRSGEKSDGFGPAFPKLTRDEAQKTAQTFLDRVLEKGLETASFHVVSGTDELSADYYNLNGGILLNGKTSPLSFHITVRTADNAVTRFDREGLAGKYMGGVPSATPAVSADKALEALKETLSLRLEYVLQEDGKTAALRYLPNSTDDFYVDAQTGKLVNLTELYAQARSGGGGMNASAPEAAMSTAKRDTAGLTGAEQEGVAKLEGVLDKAALDKMAAAISELGLSKYTLASASYSVERAERGAEAPAAAKVAARLTYGRQDKDGNTWRRYVTLDAKTGALISVSSSAPWVEDAKHPTTEAQAQKKAEAFLDKYYAAEYAKTALYTRPAARAVPLSIRYDSAYSFQYAQKESGYFFPANSLSVGVDASDGSVSAFSRSFDGAVTFDGTEGIIALEKAVDAYLATFEAPCVYLDVPQKLDLSAPEWRVLSEMGVSYLYTLKLGYALDGKDEGYLEGIDAKTGEAIFTKYEPASSGLTYDDLDGNWVKTMAEKLALYGVGYLGGSFLPAQELTQLDLVALLASANGYLYDPAPENKDAAADLYRAAYSMGILTKADRDDQKAMTRADVVKLLLDSAGYGKVAQLDGIFKCNFADAATIPAAYYGYAALAQGLGIVGGDGAGNFAPSRTATRAEAAGMLYHFMSR